MFPHVLLSLMLASPPGTVNAEVVQTYDLGKMTWAEAKRLAGKPIRVSFDVAIPLDMDGKLLIFAEGWKEASRLIFSDTSEFREVPILDGKRYTLVVHGMLRVKTIPPREWNGWPVPELNSIEIHDARLVRP